MPVSSCHPRRGNITIVVLLLMVASGLLALLTLQFVKHFLTSSSVLGSYYRAYYMARGGLETLLTESNVRGYGFEHDLSQSPSIGSNYYTNCQQAGLCHLDGKTVSQGQSITNSIQSLTSTSCLPAEMITIQPGHSSAFPLFYDRGVGAPISFIAAGGSDYTKISPLTKGFDVTLIGGNLQAYLYDAGVGTFGSITATQTIGSPNALNLFAGKSLVYTHWLILSNPSTAVSAVSYCLKSDDAAKIVGDFTRITSQATYDDKTVGLTAIKKFVFPSVFIQ